MIEYKSKIDEIDIQDWRSFVLNHFNGNIFQTPEYYKVLEQSQEFEPIFIGAFQNKSLTGILLGVIQSENIKYIKPLTSRCIVWGGPLAYDNEIAKHLLHTLNSTISKRVLYAQFRNIKSVKYLDKSFLAAGYEYENHLDILIDLRKGSEVLWNEMNKNRRKEIKKGLKKGVYVDIINLNEDPSSNLEELYRILKLLYKKIGLPFPSINFFENAIKIFEPIGFMKTFVAKFSGKIIGFRMVLIYKDLIYDWYAASDPKYLEYRPNDILPWEIIKWGSENGYETFDFGGAGKPNEQYGVREYKERFGGTMVSFGRYYKKLQPTKLKISSLAFHVWSSYKKLF